MTIYVDPLVAYGQPAKSGNRHFGGGKQSCHLITDGPLEELHAFAKRIGLRREWFQYESIPHYDLTPRRREAAVKAGAQEVTTGEAIQAYRQSRQKAPGEFQ